MSALTGDPPPAPVAEPAVAARPTTCPRHAADPGVARSSGTACCPCPARHKEVREFWTFDSPREVSYRAGDALGVRPSTARARRRVARRHRVGPGRRWSRWTAVRTRCAPRCTTELDISRITPDLLSFVAERSGGTELRDLLRPGNNSELARWTWGRQAVDVVAELAARRARRGAGRRAKRLQPRQYSISSSPLRQPGRGRADGVRRPVRDRRRAAPGRCVLDVPRGRPAGTHVPVLVQPTSHFRPPAARPAMIMVGPGTGVAPFVGFLARPRGAGHTGPQLAVLRRAAPGDRLLLPRRAVATASTRARSTASPLAFSRDQR